MLVFLILLNSLAVWTCLRWAKEYNADGKRTPVWIHGLGALNLLYVVVNIGRLFLI
jgi:hypothetical protein